MLRRPDLDKPALEAAGANPSLIHVDWMIGSADTDVDGLGAAGNARPLMRAGK